MESVFSTFTYQERVINSEEPDFKGAEKVYITQLCTMLFQQSQGWLPVHTGYLCCTTQFLSKIPLFHIKMTLTFWGFNALFTTLFSDLSIDFSNLLTWALLALSFCIILLNNIHTARQILISIYKKYSKSIEVNRNVWDLKSDSDQK